MKKSLLLFSFLLTIGLKAQELPDSVVKTYNLGEISVTGFKIEELAVPQITKIDFMELRKADALDLSRLQKNIPSGRIRTNSRGESILFLRGAGERQLGLFFDGVPYNVPWDNRFDLTFLPLDVVGEVAVSQNANSVLYGPNVLGGAVNVNTYERGSDGSNASLSFNGSNAETYSASASYDLRKGKFNFIASGSWLDSKGSTMPSGTPLGLINQDPEAKYITNSDRKRISLFTRGEWHFSDDAKTGFSVNFVSGSKGVSPETHIPTADARLWRYPEWHRLMISSNSKFKLSSKTDLTAVLWFDNFGQKIDTYSGLDFATVSESQKDKDVSFGGRLSSSYRINEQHALTGVFNFQTTSHNEGIFNSGNTQTSDLDYTGSLLSAGLEYSFKLDGFSVVAGGLFDLDMKGKTGAFAQYENTNTSAPGLFASASYMLSENWEVFAGVTYRNRFPSLREQFSGALNRFKANPDLKPEKGTLTDFGFIYSDGPIRVKLSGFYNSYTDLITQIRLTAAQDPQRRRMRVNLADARIIGAEAVFSWKPSRVFALDGNITWMDAKGKADGVSEDKIDNKPEVLGGLSIEVRPIRQLGISLETELTGMQVETNPSAPAQKLEIAGSAVFNARVAWSLVAASWSADLFVRANNIFDHYRVYQLGIIEPGRSITGGVSFRL
ncbi:MAG: TonB-dependent receptor [Ignavibacteriaceae bacterium]|nr:MAG: TonB-dependent receptor [Ignavibacteriaceae bacterium]